MRKKKQSFEDQTSVNKKSSNKNSIKNQQSILAKHEKKLLEFKNKNDRIKVLDTKIKTLTKEINLLKQELDISNKNNSSYDTNCYKIQKIENELSNLKNTKADINSGYEESHYLLESSNIIMKYIDLENQEKFLLNKENLSDEKTNELNKIVIQKNDLVDEYLKKFDNNYVSFRHAYIKDLGICESCGNNMETSSGFLTCISCGACKNTLDCHNELSYKEMQDYDYRPQFTYEKKSHLEDWLRRFTAKENRTISQEILDKVIIEAKKEKLKDLSLLTEEKVKRYLKKLNLNDYYDNVINIINRINGRPPFTLTSEIEDKIKTMFQQIQEPYERYKPPNRRNFLSYSYCLHQMFKILGLHEFAKYFPLLKSADKLRQQDEIFKKIVAEMAQKDKSINWVFYPSI
jgi:hypothetical protein